MQNRLIVAAILLVQAVCALFFVSDILLSVFGIYTAPIGWQTREYLEIGAALGLILGLGMGASLLHQSIRARHRAEAKLRRAAGAFAELLDDLFEEWALTPAERDVALFAIKGMSTAEIAMLRATSEGTVKAQTTAIYRKAGVSGRPQLLGLFIDDLMEQRGPGPAG